MRDGCVVVSDEVAEMLAGLLLALYVATIGSAAAALFVAIDWLEPNYQFARVLKLLVFVAAAAAIINRLLP